MKAKGMSQVLLERELYIPGMTNDQAKAVLMKCCDFKNEMSALETYLVDRGHLLLISPKCHPELAGCGIEYMFAKIKWTFRRHTNDTGATNLSHNVYQAITKVNNVEDFREGPETTEECTLIFIKTIMLVQIPMKH
jgi:hypothetical protein